MVHRDSDFCILESDAATGDENIEALCESHRIPVLAPPSNAPENLVALYLHQELIESGNACDHDHDDHNTVIIAAIIK